MRLRTPDERAAAARLDVLRAEIRRAHGWAREHNVHLAAELTIALWHYAFERQWTEPASWAADLTDRLDPGDPAVLATKVAQAADASNRGDYEQAERLAQAALASGDHRVRAIALDTLGNIGLYTGDLELAHEHSLALIALGEANDDAAIYAVGISSQTLYHVYGGRLDDARRVLDSANWPANPSPTGEAWMAYTIGELRSASGEQDAAIQEFDRAISLGEPVGSQFVVSVARVSSLAAATRSDNPLQSVQSFLSVLERYRRIRSYTHAVTAMRNLVEVLVRAGMHEAAMVLLGGLSNPKVKSTYGAESERIDEARTAATDAAGSSRVDGWISQGAAHDVTWTLDYAVDVLTGLTEQSVP